MIAGVQALLSADQVLRVTVLATTPLIVPPFPSRHCNPFFVISGLAFFNGVCH